MFGEGRKASRPPTKRRGRGRCRGRRRTGRRKGNDHNIASGRGVDRDVSGRKGCREGIGTRNVGEDGDLGLRRAEIEGRRRWDEVREGQLRGDVSSDQRCKRMWRTGKRTYEHRPTSHNLQNFFDLLQCLRGCASLDVVIATGDNAHGFVGGENSDGVKEDERS
jgi:hypothetical protein